MTRDKFDQFAKDLFESVLAPIGDVVRGKEVMAEPLEIDIAFQASSSLSEEARDRFGLPGRLLERTSYFEPYRKPLEVEHLWNGAAKVTWSWLAARRKVRSAEDVEESPLWIVTPSASAGLLERAGFKPMGKAGADGDVSSAWWEERRWPPGLYSLPGMVPVRVVVISELPEVAQTLTLRLLGRGGTLLRALEALRGLSPEDPLRTPLLHLLEKWRIIEVPAVELDAQDQEVCMYAKLTYEEWSEERREEGRKEGLEEGVKKGVKAGDKRGSVRASRAALLRFWPRLYGDMPGELRSRIEGSDDPDLLDAAMQALSQSTSQADAEARIRTLLG
jgi:hypothetical protein